MDCVRLANLGLVEGFEAELVVSGINHGSNLGDDITYSGTVAAALEAIVLGLPGIAVSQQSSARELDFKVGRGVRLRGRGDVHGAPGGGARDVPLPVGHAAERQRPLPAPRTASRWRGWASASTATSSRSSTRTASGRRLYRIYGDASYERDETGTDLAAVAQGKIAVTPVHFDLTDRRACRCCERYNLERLVEPAAERGDRAVSAPAKQARDARGRAARR